MIFNNTIEQTNLLSSPYLQGNILFHPQTQKQQQNTIYSPVLNLVKKTDLIANQSSVLPGLETPNNITKMCIDPLGAVLIAVDIVGYAVVYNLKGNFVIAEFNFKDFVRDIGYSSDGKLVYVLTGNGFVVYEAPGYWRSFQPFLLIKKYKNRHSGKINGARFSPDNRFLITWGQDNIIYINNLFPIQGYLPITLQVHRFKILGVSFSSQKMQYLYSVDSGSNIYAWKWIGEEEITEGYKNRREMEIRRRKNLRKGHQNKQVLKKIKREEEEDEEEEYEKFNELYSDFECQITKGRYILAKKLIVTQPASYLKRYSYNPALKFLALAYSSGKFSIYRLQQQQLTEIQTLSIGNYKISTLSLNDSCTWLALGIKSLGQLIVWEWKSQSYIFKQKGLIYDSVAVAVYKNGGKFIATGTNDGEVKLWEKKSGFSVASFFEHSASVKDIKFSNQNTLFSCGLDGNVHAYDAVKYKKFRTYRADVNCQFHCLAVQEAGEIIMAGSFDPYEVYAWNTQTANILQIIKGHEGPISCIQVAGDHLITGSWDRTLKIHELYARKLNVETLQHSSQITALAMHPNGKKVAAATIKGQIYIWELENSGLVGIIEADMKGGRSYFSKVSAQNDANSKYLKALVFTDCGNYLLGGGKSKYLNIYDVNNRVLIKRIQITRNRDLQGTIQKLNSKYIKEGQATYQMGLEEQEQNFSDDDADDGFNKKMPGSKKLDISEIRKKLEVEIRGIVKISAVEIGICTSFGVLIFSSNPFQKKQVFNPYELVSDMSPSLIKTLIQERKYSAAMSGTLSLNLSVSPVINLIPVKQIKQIVSELNENTLELFLKQLGALATGHSKGINLKECLWLDAILSRYPNINASYNLRSSIENLLQQAALLGKTKDKLGVSQILALC